MFIEQDKPVSEYSYQYINLITIFLSCYFLGTDAFKYIDVKKNMYNREGLSSIGEINYSFNQIEQRFRINMLFPLTSLSLALIFLIRSTA